MRNQNLLSNILENQKEGVRIGKVERLSPLVNRKGKVRLKSTVITPQGLGVIKSQWPETWTGSKPGNRVEVYLNRKYIKSFYLHEVSQFVVFDESSKQYKLLSPQCYGYIFEENQLIPYRITKRQYAMMTDDYKNALDIVNKISKYRAGISMMKEIRDDGYILVKAGEEVHYDPAKLLNDFVGQKIRMIGRRRKTLLDKVNRRLRLK